MLYINIDLCGLLNFEECLNLILHDTVNISVLWRGTIMSTRGGGGGGQISYLRS
jgi:hypothetical protein